VIAGVVSLQQSANDRAERHDEIAILTAVDLKFQHLITDKAEEVFDNGIAKAGFIESISSCS
jgi:hypothetical protein